LAAQAHVLKVMPGAHDFRQGYPQEPSSIIKSVKEDAFAVRLASLAGLGTWAIIGVPVLLELAGNLTLLLEPRWLVWFVAYVSFGSVMLATRIAYKPPPPPANPETNAVGEFAQNVVSRLVAVGVVDALEVVDVKDEERHGLAVLGAPLLEAPLQQHRAEELEIELLFASRLRLSMRLSLPLRSHWFEGIGNRDDNI
jgi:hypothetical protein